MSRLEIRAIQSPRRTRTALKVSKVFFVAGLQRRRGLLPSTFAALWVFLDEQRIREDDVPVEGIPRRYRFAYYSRFPTFWPP